MTFLNCIFAFLVLFGSRVGDVQMRNDSAACFPENLNSQELLPFQAVAPAAKQTTFSLLL